MEGESLSVGEGKKGRMGYEWAGRMGDGGWGSE